MAYIHPKQVQDRKVKKLHKRLKAVEQQMSEQAILRRKIEELSVMDAVKTQMAIEKANNSAMLLKGEIERVYGTPKRSPSPPPNNKVVEEIISKRTKDFHHSQAQKAANIQFLSQERQRILDARHRLKEKQTMFRSLPSPVGSTVSEIEMKPPGSRTPSYRSVHSAGSQVRKAVNDMPDAMDRIWNLRDSLHEDYVRKGRPYAGELGIDSYQSWQIPDFLMVRRLLQDFIEDFLIKHVPPDHVALERDMKLFLLSDRDRQWTQTSKALSERTAVKLLAEEILLEITSKMTKEVANEGIHQDVMFKRISGNLFMKEAEVQATDNPRGRDPTDPAYDLITTSFHTLQKNRDHHKKNVWAHSQAMSHPALPPPQPIRRIPAPEPPKPASKKTRESSRPQPQVIPPTPAVIKEEAPLDADVDLIKHDHLHPIDLKLTDPRLVKDSKAKRRKLWTSIYRKRELHYWNNLKPFVFTTSVAKRCQGITVLQPAPDHMQLAAGTTSGDVLVFNTQVEPWAVVKMDLGQASDGSVTHLAWSLDSYQLLAVKNSGSVHVWMTRGQPAGKEALKAMEFSVDDSKPQPLALVSVLSLDARKGDFNFISGTLQQQGSSREQQRSVIGAFFPTLTFLSAQNSVCAGMDGGDILKLDLEDINYTSPNDSRPTNLLRPKVQGNSEEPNLTRQNIPTELLRQHKHPIIHMGFIGNLGKMITVDRKGFINIWKYDRSHITGFDWFFPEKKYKLDFNKTMYSPSSGENTKVIFSDRNRSKTTTRAQIARERRQAQRNLDNMQLGDPWHISMDSPGLNTYIYIPPGGAKGSGAMFNVIIRHRKTQQLSTHMTRMYRPVKVNCTRLVTVSQSPSGNELVFVLLFPEFPPKGPHLMILVLHLPTMKLRNFRKDIELTNEEHRDISQVQICSADMSQVYGPTGSQYLFMTLNGRLSCISLNTGSEVLKVDNVSRPKAPTFPGLRLDTKQMTLSKYHKVTTLGNFGSLYAALYDKSTTAIKVLRLDDGNSHEDSRLMCKAYEKWEGYDPAPNELRIDPVDWALPDMKHVEAEMRSLILSLPYQQEEATPDEQKKEKIANYLPLREKVNRKGLLYD